MEMEELRKGGLIINEEMQTAMDFMVNQQVQTAVKLDRLTDDRLNAPLNVVERQISDGRKK